MEEFVNFLLSKTFFRGENEIVSQHIDTALNNCIEDVRYHFPDLSDQEIISNITCNQNILPIFLYRLGNIIYQETPNSETFWAIHWIMRECCSCEIYFSNTIDTGLYIQHGLGTVIGSRNKIGKGFKIYHGCTIGHKKDKGRGNIIGSNVTVYTNSQIIGELTIGENVIIGSHSIVLTNIPSNVICYGIPARIHRRNDQNP